MESSPTAESKRLHGDQGDSDSVQNGIRGGPSPEPSFKGNPSLLNGTNRSTPAHEQDHFGIRDAATDVKEELDGAMAFQEAILTSDTCTKSCSAKIETSAGEITVGGVVKGAGMIEPNMATMLAFLTTDASVSNPFLQDTLAKPSIGPSTGSP